MGALDTVKGGFTEKIGPLPAIAWAGMAGAAYVIYRYATVDRDSAPATTTVIPETGSVGTASDFSDGYGNAAGSYSGSGSAGGSTTATVPPVGIQDNVTWGQRAINYLISTGTDVADANTAIRAFLFESDTPLNTSQFAAWQRALTFLGAPPEGIPNTPQQAQTNNPPAPTPAPTTPTPAPAPAEPSVPYPTRPFTIIRYNGGPDGPGSFVAIFQGTNGSIGWVPDGATYLGFLSAFPLRTVSEAEFVNIINNSPKFGPAPRWLPPGAKW